MGWLERMGRRRRKECVECGSKLMPFAWPEARGQAGEYTMVLRGLPVLRCSADSKHPMREVDDESSVLLAEAIQSSELAVGRFGFADARCFRCGVGLDRHDDDLLTTRADVDLGESGMVDVELTGPATTCGACGTRQVLATYDPEDDYNSALCACFDAVPFDS